MKKVLLKDDLLEESRLFKNLFYLFFTLACGFPLSLVVKNITLTEFIKGEIILVIISLVLLFLYLVFKKYTVLVYEDEIIIEKIFKKIIIKKINITKYSYDKKMSCVRLIFFVAMINMF